MVVGGVSCVEGPLVPDDALVEDEPRVLGVPVAGHVELETVLERELREVARRPPAPRPGARCPQGRRGRRGRSPPANDRRGSRVLTGVHVLQRRVAGMRGALFRPTASGRRSPLHLVRPVAEPEPEGERQREQPPRRRSPYRSRLEPRSSSTGPLRSLLSLRGSAAQSDAEQTAILSSRGASTICVCVTNATSFPSSRSMRVWPTMVDRPTMHRRRQVPTTLPPSIPAEKKFVFDSMVVVRVRLGGRFSTVPYAPSVSAKAHERAAVHAPRHRAEPARHLDLGAQRRLCEASSNADVEASRERIPESDVLQHRSARDMPASVLVARGCSFWATRAWSTTARISPVKTGPAFQHRASPRPCSGSTSAPSSLSGCCRSTWPMTLR